VDGQKHNLKAILLCVLLGCIHGNRKNEGLHYPRKVAPSNGVGSDRSDNTGGSSLQRTGNC
jgi:hypothetical protein